MYWIRERFRILTKKQEGLPKPWSDDPVFQRTYFCNVRREDDKVTKWIRDYYSPHVAHPLFEYNILLSRFLNWPPSLEAIGYQETYNPAEIALVLGELSDKQKIWGNAYVITTHGIKMPKLVYLCGNVLPAAYMALSNYRTAVPHHRLGATARVLQEIEGVGPFLSGQIIADLKNTQGHPLEQAEDWWTFVQPGPGSMRGLYWFLYGAPGAVNETSFINSFPRVRDYFDAAWVKDKSIPYLSNQDLQNCLCEFDKYMRVKNGTGKSKRVYHGI